MPLASVPRHLGARGVVDIASRKHLHIGGHTSRQLRRRRRYRSAKLKASEAPSSAPSSTVDDVEEEAEAAKPDVESWQKYKIPHRFVGFNPKRMDLERLPTIRTDFDGNKGRLIWHGTECQKCGLQVRREKRTNREASLNIYAHDSIPPEMLRSCPEIKRYPVLWRSRDPFLALDILGVDD